MNAILQTEEKYHPLLPHKTDVAPAINGKLDDSVWQKAPTVSGFKTWVPDYGVDMADKTEVYCAYDPENFYVAFRCFDSEPDKIKSSVTSRDNIYPDDWVCVNLDSFNDQQSNGSSGGMPQRKEIKKISTWIWSGSDSPIAIRWKWA